jgi:hypothetical protein
MWTCEAGGPEVGVEELRTFSNIAGARGGPVGVRPRSYAEPPPAGAIRFPETTAFDRLWGIGS